MRVPKFLSKIATNVSNNGLFSGIATFPGFLLPEAVASAIADIEQDSEKAWQETHLILKWASNLWVTSFLS